MDLLKYLEPMKNLPERFSNLAFWRGVRKLRDDVVNAFEYVDSWGTHIESVVLTETKISTAKNTINNVAALKEHFKITELNDLSCIELDFTQVGVRILNDIENVDVLSAVALAELDLGNYPTISVTLPVTYRKNVGFDLSCDSIIRIPLPFKVAPSYIPSATFTIYYSHK
jgi:hypothetical protein